MWPVILFALQFGIAVDAGTIKQTRVAVVDTGLELRDPRFSALLCKDARHTDFTGEGIADSMGHGTHVAGLIKQYAGRSNYCLIILKFYSPAATNEMNTDREVMAMRSAVEQHADIINFSGGGPVWNNPEYYLIRSNPKVTWVVAAGNNDEDIGVYGQEYFPASYSLPNVKAIGSLTYNCGKESYTKARSSNYGRRVEYWEIGDRAVSTLPYGSTGEMSGTSMATGIATGKLIAGRLKAWAEGHSPLPYREVKCR